MGLSYRDVVHFQTGELNQNTIVILNNVRFQDLEHIIRFVYHGEVNVPHKDLEKFLKTAELLQIEGLAQPEGDKGSPFFSTVLPNIISSLILNYFCTLRIFAGIIG